ncbi:heavy metal-binding domain-containing protein [Microbacterium sp.]
MLGEAQNRGANAVVAMRFDTDSIGNFTEVCAYGTAVVIEPLAVPAPPTA